MQPFIHQLHTPRNNYVYDVNRNTVLPVSQNVSAALEHPELPVPAECAAEIDRLKSRGYLSDRRVQTIRHRHLNDLEYQLDYRLEQLILQVTQCCNLACSYCPFANQTEGAFQRNHSQKKMEWETARKALDFFLERSSEIIPVSISFYGGEPFLAFPLIRKAVAYVHETYAGKDYSFSLTTNGTVMNDEIIAFLAENRFRVMFSIDGPAAIHDSSRRHPDGSGSFAAAFSNLKKTAAAYGDAYKDKISINMVINPEQDFDGIAALFDDPFFREYPVSLNASVASSEKLENPLQANADFNEKQNYNLFLGLLAHFHLVSGLEVSPMIRSIINVTELKTSLIKPTGRLPETDAPAGPCVPGQRRLFVTAEGRLFPCERVNELADDLMIGDVDHGFDMQKAASVLNIGALTPDVCKNCWAFRNCNICAVNAAGANRITAADKLKHCNASRSSFQQKLSFHILQQEIYNIYKKELKE